MKLTRATSFAIIAVAAALAMGWALPNSFVYDDWPAIARNARVIDPAQWYAIPGSPYWLGTLWRPLTVMIFALEWWAGHGNAPLFHAVSLLAYVAVGWMVYRLLLRLRVDATVALAGVLIFVVHPVHVEVVASAVGQAELWVALSLIGSTLFYLHVRETGPTLPRLLALLAMVTVGIASKEQGFMALPLLAGAEWLLLQHRGERTSARFRLLIPVAALSALLLAVRAVVLGNFAGETPAVALQGLTIGGRVLTFLATVPEYARLLLWPVHLQADYGPPGLPVGGPIILRHLMGALILMCIVALFLWSRRRYPAAAFGLWWAAITMAPVSNVLTPTGLVMAERVLFLPTIGAIVAGAVLMSGRRRSRAWTTQLPLAIVVSWLLVMTVRSATRIAVWRDQPRFFTAIARDAPDAYHAWMVAGKYWDTAGDQALAEASLSRSIALWPHDYEGNERLAQLLRVEHRCDRAAPVLVAGLAIDADAASSRAKLVECLIVLHRWDEANAVAAEGVRRGQMQFAVEQARVVKFRAAADSGR